MKIIEKFFAFQGEGRTQGKNSLFIRFPHCNLLCTNCDSKYTWYEDNIKDVPDEEVFKMIDKADNIIFTGGEPLILENFNEIEKILKKFPVKTYEIETNGKIFEYSEKYFKILKWIEVDRYDISFNISPKENFEQEDKNINVEPILLKSLQADGHSKHFIVKYLFNCDEDIEYIKEQQKKYQLENRQIYAQPKGITSNKIKELITKYYDVILENGWNLSNRSHIFIFENKRGV